MRPIRTVAPEDVWLAYEEARGRYFYTDVMAAGAYPAWKLRALEKEGVHVPFEPGDTEYLAEHTVDFISFSYYCSRLVCADDQVIAEKAEGNVFPTLRNPYLKDKETAWKWQIDALGLRVTLAGYHVTIFRSLSPRTVWADSMRWKTAKSTMRIILITCEGIFLRCAMQLSRTVLT